MLKSLFSLKIYITHATHAITIIHLFIILVYFELKQFLFGNFFHHGKFSLFSNRIRIIIYIITVINDKNRFEHNVYLFKENNIFQDIVLQLVF